MRLELGEVTKKIAPLTKRRDEILDALHSQPRPCDRCGSWVDIGYGLGSERYCWECAKATRG